MENKWPRIQSKEFLALPKLCCHKPCIALAQNQLTQCRILQDAMVDGQHSGKGCYEKHPTGARHCPEKDRRRKKGGKVQWAAMVSFFFFDMLLLLTGAQLQRARRLSCRGSQGLTQLHFSYSPSRKHHDAVIERRPACAPPSKPATTKHQKNTSMFTIRAVQGG